MSPYCCVNRVLPIIRDMPCQSWDWIIECSSSHVYRNARTGQIRRLRVEPLESRDLLAALVEIESATVRDLCAEHDGVQEKFYAVQQQSGQTIRADAFGQAFTFETAHPGYGAEGRIIQSPDWTNCELSGGGAAADMEVGRFESGDGKYVLVAYKLDQFPAPWTRTQGKLIRLWLRTNGLKWLVRN
ncbi:MAG: hypothetical protein ACKO38_06585 [Planctomycetota bacterium]